MPMRGIAYQRGSIANLWATQHIADKIIRELKGERKVTTTYYAHESGVTGAVYQQECKTSSGRGDVKNLWATKHIVDMVRQKKT